MPLTHMNELKSLDGGVGGYIELLKILHSEVQKQLQFLWLGFIISP